MTPKRKRILYQYILRNNQETCIPKFAMTDRYYLSIDDARAENEIECLFSVLGPYRLSRIDDPRDIEIILESQQDRK